MFDFASKTGGVSINGYLYSGPDITNDLTGVLLRFRKHKIAVSADIEEMFLQIRLCKEDRPCLTFLWYPDGDLNNEPAVYELNVHPFGATSSSFNATFVLRRIAEDHANEFVETTLRTVRENFYVDDCLASVNTIEEASTLVKELRRLLSLGGFRLHKWVSNYEEVLVGTPVTERALTNMDLSPDSAVQKSLGLYWCVSSDCFRFKLELPDRPGTRRGILSCIASLYYPLGYVAPLSLQPKRLFQELCRTRKGWYDPIEVPASAAWESWKNSILVVDDLRIPRCLTPTSFCTRQRGLYLYSDASELGYGSVAYLRSESIDGSVHCSFLMGKSRVSPLKAVTIPRLELQAAVVSVRLKQHLSRKLRFKIDYVCFWTDSTIVLHYIRNTTSKFKTFVANRLCFIHENSDISQWKYVPTEKNPADLASRGIVTRDVNATHRWLSGPDFLKLDAACWPTTSDIPTLPELPLEEKIITVLHVTCQEKPVDYHLSYFSSWMKLRRTVAWFIRYQTFLRNNIRKESKYQFIQGPLTAAEIKRAELSLIQYVQLQCFYDKDEKMHSSPSLKEIPALKNYVLW